MNCERFQTVAADLARNEITDANERVDALVHVDDCDRCAQALNDQGVLNEGLRSLADEMKSLQAPADIEEQLLAAFRDRTPVRFVSPNPFRRRYWVSAAAAVLLLAFGLLGWRWYGASVRPAPAQTNSQSDIAPPSQSPKRETAAAGGMQSPSPAVPSSAPKTLPSRRHRASSTLAKGADGKRPTVEQEAAVSDEIREVTTEFVPTGYGSASDLQYGGQLVRVELPRSVLARFGLPVNMNRADETVKADLLVGADGLARAIRFVSATNKN